MAFLLVVMGSGAGSFSRTVAGRHSAGPAPSAAGPEPVEQRGYSVFCVTPDLGSCERQINDLRRRRPFDPSLLNAAAPAADETLTAFAAASGSTECDRVVHVCRGPDTYPSAGRIAGAVAGAGIPDVRVRPVTTADALATGSTLVGARRVPGGCILILMGGTISTLTVGVVDATGECLDPA